MRSIVLASLLTLAASTAPLARPAAATTPPPAPWSRQAVQACSQVAEGPCVISSITRRELSADVAEYSFTMKIGPGVHDVIGLHRVVKELGAFLPAPPDSGIFFVHGDILGFDAAFLSSAASPAIPDSHALPVFLAERGIDVWGIDQRWVLVDGNTADLTFMQGWGLAMNASDVGVGMGIAAGVRGTNEPMDLLGWSRGGQIAYTYLSSEAVLPLAQRRVKGFIPVDIYVRTDDPTLRASACTRRDQRQQDFDAARYADKTGQLAAALGFFAEIDPNGISPFSKTTQNPGAPLPQGTTNRQASLLLGAATFGLLFPYEPTPAYHWVGGTFDSNGSPTGLSFTDETFFDDFLKGSSPLEPTKLILDAEKMMCEVPDTPFLDNLADVTVPVLYVGADGGFGTFGLFSTTLLGSTDQESINVDLAPPAARVLDFGHVDLVLGTNAETLVWSPIYDWIIGIRTQ